MASTAAYCRPPPIIMRCASSTHHGQRCVRSVLFKTSKGGALINLHFGEIPLIFATTVTMTNSASPAARWPSIARSAEIICPITSWLTRRRGMCLVLLKTINNVSSNLFTSLLRKYLPQNTPQSNRRLSPPVALWRQFHRDKLSRHIMGDAARARFCWR